MGRRGHQGEPFQIARFKRRDRLRESPLPPRSLVMCCFSRRVDKVADTSIFARPSKDDKQFLVYSMLFAAKEDLAMILPLPTPKGSPEDALRFINLEKYADFFKDMAAGFPAPPPPRGGGDKSNGPKPDNAPLVV